MTVPKVYSPQNHSKGSTTQQMTTSISCLRNGTLIVFVLYLNCAQFQIYTMFESIKAQGLFSYFPILAFSCILIVVFCLFMLHVGPNI